MNPAFKAVLAVSILVGLGFMHPVSAQVAARPRPSVGMPTPSTQGVPAVRHQSGLSNRASRLEPASFLSQNDFRALIGVVGTPNDFDVPNFTTQFKVSPLSPNAPGQGSLATRDAFEAPDYVSQIVGGGAVINYVSRVSYTYASSFDGISGGGAELTINAIRGEVYAVNCLASVNDNPNALIYYRTSNPMGNGQLLPESSVFLKDHQFVTLVKRANQNGEIKILLRPTAVVLPAAGSGSSGPAVGIASALKGVRRAGMTPEERAAEDAANAAKAAAPPPPPVRYTMKLWGCQVSSAN